MSTSILGIRRGTSASRTSAAEGTISDTADTVRTLQFKRIHPHAHQRHPKVVRASLRPAYSVATAGR